MIMNFTPVLAHNPEMILGIMGALAAVALLLNMGWYWLVGQVGFMLTCIRIPVEPWCKVAIPLLLIPVAAFVVLFLSVEYVVLLVVVSKGEISGLWVWVANTLNLALLVAIPYILGRFVLKLSNKRSLISAICQALLFFPIWVVLGTQIDDIDANEPQQITIPAEIEYQPTPEAEPAPDAEPSPDADSAVPDE